MGRAAARTIWLTTAIAVLTVTIPGCVELPRPPLLSAESRTSIRHLLVEARFTGDAGAAKTPVKGSGAGAGAGALQGAGGMLLGGLGTGDITGLALGVVLAPVGLVVGAAVGAASARSAAEVEAAQAALAAALAVQPAEALRSRVAALLASKAGIAVADGGDTSDETVGGSDEAAGTPGVLELDVTSFRVATSGAIDPDVSIAIKVTGRLWRPGDGAFIYLREWVYPSEERPYFELAADGATGMRRLLEAAFGTIAEKIVGDLFIAPTPPEERFGIGVATAVFSVALDGESSLIELDHSCRYGLWAGLSLAGEAAEISPAARNAFRVVEPGTHKVGVRCVPEAIEAATPGPLLCGRVDMRVFPGLDYRIILPEPGRVAALSARTGEAVADGATWAGDTGMFVKEPCKEPEDGTSTEAG